MDKAKLIFAALPWGLVSVVLATAGLPPPVIAFLHALWDAAPQIAAIGAPLVTSFLTVLATVKAKKAE